MMREMQPAAQTQISEIEQKINEALQEIENITKEKVKITNTEDLDRLEKRISQATDKLSGLITAQKIQQTLDSGDIKQESRELIRSLDNQMKNQGHREVEITTSRGEPVRIKAAYYSKKKGNKRKKKKKR